MVGDEDWSSAQPNWSQTMADVEILKTLIDQQIRESVAAREEAKLEREQAKLERDQAIADRDEANRRYDEG